MAAGLRALAVGNVGTSVIDAVTAKPGYDVLAVELSSFQLHWSSTVEPAAGALLNLAPDHLDWHGSMGAYALTKTKVWDTPVAIGNVDDPYVAELLAGAESRAQGRKVGVTLARADARATRRRRRRARSITHSLPIRSNSSASTTSTRRDRTTWPMRWPPPPSPGRTASRPPRSAGVFGTFVADPHRNQFLVDRGGVRYVDDSKATNPHAASASLNAYDRVVWIAGGQLKGTPRRRPGRESVASRLVGAVLLGVDRADICAALARHAPEIPVIEVARTDDGAMTEVVSAAAGLARPGDTVLLAPAAASYDMFTGYAARGAAFAAAIDALDQPDTP